jgi:allantoin racemase
MDRSPNARASSSRSEEVAASKILVINPNSSAEVTDAIDAALTPLRLTSGPEIEVVGLLEGPPSIITQRDADSVATPIANLIAEDSADAFVIACFSDPGLHGAREAAGGRPVFGIGEWGVLSALTLGERFGVIALSRPSVQRQQRMVRRMGVESRYVGSRPIDASATETTADAIFDRLVAAGRALVREHRADVVVLGCAGMAAHRMGLEEALGRPVVEPSQRAVAAAIGAVLVGSS